MPLIADDVLVHFDDDRAMHACDTPPSLDERIGNRVYVGVDSAVPQRYRRK